MEFLYTLTLTRPERQAFNMVEGRYNETDVMDFLVECLPANRGWNDDGDITFRIPEHIAWEIDQLAKEEQNTWPMFNDELANKLNGFLLTIV